MQNNAKDWAKFSMISVFFVCLGCVNFHLYMILINDFRTAFKGLNLKERIFSRTEKVVEEITPSENVEETEL